MGAVGAGLGGRFSLYGLCYCSVCIVLSLWSIEVLSILHWQVEPVIISYKEGAFLTCCNRTACGCLHNQFAV